MTIHQYTKERLFDRNQKPMNQEGTIISIQERNFLIEKNDYRS